MPRKSQSKWRWTGDKLGRMSAVIDEHGQVVCGSLICQVDAFRIKAHERIVAAVNAQLDAKEKELLESMLEDALKRWDHDDSFEAFVSRGNQSKYRRLVKKLCQ